MGVETKHFTLRRVVLALKRSTQPTQPYDLIVDAAAYRPFSDFLSAIAPGGIYVMIGGASTIKS
ncbi:MAG: hypothetical protein AAGL17_18145 [Cyanobacteria bacterium J06576_12]